jgi:trans-2,3-dihydro-3-hydroxyanthranilate isomerase
MELPAPSPEAFDRAEALLDALGVDAAALPVEQYRNGPRHVLVALTDEAAVATLDPDLSAVARIGEIAVSCFAGSGRRWKTRMFAPALGVPEDPATGSAAAPLAVHLARHGRIPIGEGLDLHQGAEIGRTSLLRVTVEGRAEDDRIDGVSVAGGVALIGGGEIVA